MLLLMPFALMFVAESVFAQSAASVPEILKARINAAALALGNNPRAPEHPKANATEIFVTVPHETKYGAARSCARVGP